jgi:hypothetical protein
VRRALPAVAIAATCGLGAAAWPYTVDDAYVLARYARRIAHGAGYAFQDGPPTDGVTGPLGLLPGLLGELTLGDPVGPAKLGGLLATALAVALVVRAARDAPHGALTLVLALVGSTPVVWSVAGLETGLATLAFTVAALSTLEARGVVTGVAVASLAWLRPELALAAGVLVFAHARHGRRTAGAAIALATLGALSIVALRLMLFETPLPLSAQAKPPDLAHGAEYVLRATLVQLGLGGPVVAWLAARDGAAGERVVLAALGAHLLALVLAGGDWMPGFRLLAPVLPIYAWLAASAIATRLRTGRRAAAVGLLAACALVPALDSVLQLGPVREAGHARDTAGAELADWVRSHGRRVAMVDIGFVGLRSEVEVVDLGGITDPAIGRLPGGHLDKRIDPGLLRARDPDVIVLHSSAPPRVDEAGRLVALAGYPVEQRVAAMRWIVAEWRVVRVIPYAPEYFYVVLARRGPSASSPAPAVGGTLTTWSRGSPPVSSSQVLRCARRASRAR